MSEPEAKPLRRTGRRKVLKTVEVGEERYELVRVTERYYLRCYAGTELCRAFRLHPDALRDLGTAMLVEGAINEWKG